MHKAALGSDNIVSFVENLPLSANKAAALFVPPASPGAPREVAADIFWARLPLPFQLDHVNLYLLRDADVLGHALL